MIPSYAAQASAIPQGLPLRQLIELASPMPPFILELREKIRNGQKWQTRRVCAPQPLNDLKRSYFVEDAYQYEKGLRYIKPKYPRGLRYLREPLCKGEDGLAHYRDDRAVVIDRDGQSIKWRWKNDVLTQIFMPRDAARYFVNWEVVGIQKVADITIQDVKAEGVVHTMNYGPILYNKLQRLWDGINAKRGHGFETNPYVWVYEFHPYQRGNS